MPLEERGSVLHGVARHSQNSRHGEEAVNRAGIFPRAATQFLGVGFAFIAQRIVFRGEHQARRRAVELRGEER